MMGVAQQCDLASLKCPVQYGSNSMFYVGVTFITIKIFFFVYFKESEPSDLVHWEDPEGSGGEGGERGDRDGEYM